ncbi:ISKra4 family transposase, partial [Synechocystis salina LEGE 06155]|nr:ISKra4 family transposase [Synechocystis salina LEGE 06155]
MCAKTSYQQAEEDLWELMAVKIGHSSLHRLVGRKELPLAQSESPGVGVVSIDGGKICHRGEEEQGGQWRDYKLVSGHGDICEAFFQEPETLEKWSNSLPLAPIITFVGDGHPGVWKVVENFAPQQELIRRQVLDWYHLVEN